MNRETLNKLKELAQKAIDNGPGNWPFHSAAFKAHITPTAVLELIALAERTTSPVSHAQDPLHARLDSLAMALWRQHYRETAPEFELLPDAAGVLSQIDNMVSGLSLAAAAPHAQDNEGEKA